MAQLVLLAAAAPARLVPSDLGGLAARRGTRRTWGRGPAVAAGRRLAGTRRPGLAGSGLRRRRSPGGTLARSPARAHRGAALRGGRPRRPAPLPPLSTFLAPTAAAARASAAWIAATSTPWSARSWVARATVPVTGSSAAS